MRQKNIGASIRNRDGKSVARLVKAIKALQRINVEKLFEDQLVESTAIQFDQNAAYLYTIHPLFLHNTYFYRPEK